MSAEAKQLGDGRTYYVYEVRPRLEPAVQHSVHERSQSISCWLNRWPSPSPSLPLASRQPGVYSLQQDHHAQPGGIHHQGKHQSAACGRSPLLHQLFNLPKAPVQRGTILVYVGVGRLPTAWHQPVVPSPVCRTGWLTCSLLAPQTSSGVRRRTSCAPCWRRSKHEQPIQSSTFLLVCASLQPHVFWALADRHPNSIRHLAKGLHLPGLFSRPGINKQQQGDSEGQRGASRRQAGFLTVRQRMTHAQRLRSITVAQGGPA